MNRQLRRAQEKAQEKQDREKQRAKAAKRAKRARRREKRARPKAKTANPAPRRRPDLFFRFAGPITIFTTTFIILQALAPRPEQNSIGMIVEVAYYFIFGYGLCIWLTKRGRNNALWLSVAVGIALAAALQLAVFFIPGLAPNVLVLLVGSAVVVLGALAGRWVANRMVQT